jgi:hypothetical protein
LESYLRLWDKPASLVASCCSWDRGRCPCRRMSPAWRWARTIALCPTWGRFHKTNIIVTELKSLTVLFIIIFLVYENSLAFKERNFKYCHQMSSCPAVVVLGTLVPTNQLIVVSENYYYINHNNYITMINYIKLKYFIFGSTFLLERKKSTFSQNSSFICQKETQKMGRNRCL